LARLLTQTIVRPGARRWSPTAEKRRRTQQRSSIAQYRRLDCANFASPPVLIDEEDGISAVAGRGSPRIFARLDECSGASSCAPHAEQPSRLCARRNKRRRQRRLVSAMLRARNRRAGRAGFDLNLTGFDEFRARRFNRRRTQVGPIPDGCARSFRATLSRSRRLRVLGRHRLLCGAAPCRPYVERRVSWVRGAPYGHRFRPTALVDDPRGGIAPQPREHPVRKGHRRAIGEVVMTTG